MSIAGFAAFTSTFIIDYGLSALDLLFIGILVYEIPNIHAAEAASTCIEYVAALKELKELFELYPPVRDKRLQFAKDIESVERTMSTPWLNTFEVFSARKAITALRDRTLQVRAQVDFMCLSSLIMCEPLTSPAKVGDCSSVTETHMDYMNAIFEYAEVEMYADLFNIIATKVGELEAQHRF